MTAITEESIVLVVTIEDYHRKTAFMPQVSFFGHKILPKQQIKANLVSMPELFYLVMLPFLFPQKLARITVHVVGYYIGRVERRIMVG